MGCEWFWLGQWTLLRIEPVVVVSGERWFRFGLGVLNCREDGDMGLYGDRLFRLGTGGGRRNLSDMGPLPPTGASGALQFPTALLHNSD